MKVKMMKIAPQAEAAEAANATTIWSTSILTPIESIQFVNNIFYNRFVNKTVVTGRMLAGVAFAVSGTLQEGFELRKNLDYPGAPAVFIGDAVVRGHRRAVVRGHGRADMRAHRLSDRWQQSRQRSSIQKRSSIESRN